MSSAINKQLVMNSLLMAIIALFTIIRTDRNMLLACYSHKHISYRIRTIIRKAITIAFQNNLMHHSFCKKHSTLSLHFFWVRSLTQYPVNILSTSSFTAGT
ncbi:hypothetical protein [Wolbachia endosymbiont (group A) of Scambus nigricans]|uniref:hypothetical protein n=1 Tax=Wolbachia endosymbiont (group A) of Scambus nigricans TaxID=2954055 RepID=UPI00222F65A0|nr:hypothetical protein [Wolbachia endosymbiont (group A) of Scambus nigricans]